ncbi:hypothetical protein JNUCC0626_13850 [Lentzea sp. JNUCC 0626]|uniref:hypothetical protein n=1 Tax=Lentzea sp. JNUCC 0626 TaxID=3367513 RepID=UPI00374943CC
MATTEEIRLRVIEADKALSLKRAGIAERIGDLAQRHSALAAELLDTKSEMSRALAEAENIISLKDLAKFTDVPIDVLTSLAAPVKTRRPRRRRVPVAQAADEAPPAPAVVTP